MNPIIPLRPIMIIKPSTVWTVKTQLDVINLNSADFNEVLLPGETFFVVKLVDDKQIKKYWYSDHSVDEAFMLLANNKVYLTSIDVEFIDYFLKRQPLEQTTPN